MQDKVQLKREEVVGNDIVLEDINPNTKTGCITDDATGLNLDQALAMIRNMINNKLARNVNSVNGRSGVVVLDASDVGLGNVDDVSFGEIKQWVIDYIGAVFGNKRIILREYLTEIHEILGTNDKGYADIPFYTEKGNATTEDFMSYIGYIYWDETTNTLKEEHLQINVIGFTDRSLIYNNSYQGMDNGGLGVNIWSKEDALKIRNNIVNKNGYSPEDLQDSGLWIDKDKIVPNVYFFDGVYGDITDDGGTTHSENGLVYWTSNPYDTTIGNLPVIQIKINGVDISLTSTSGVNPQALHTEQDLKVGDIILTNFAFDNYINPDNTSQQIDLLYPGMVDSLTCRQPALGRVIQAANLTTNTPCIIDFKPTYPNVSHGLKLLDTNSSYGSPKGNTVGLDLMEVTLRMNDGTIIYPYPGSNVSGVNALDKHYLPYRAAKTAGDKEIYTIYPTGKSDNLLNNTGKQIETNSMFILPNYSLCVIPGYELTQHTAAIRPLMNWNPSSPMGNNHDLGDRKWNMLGINLAKIMWTDPDSHSQTPTYENARNISGLRVNTDSESLTDKWFGYGSDTTPKEFEGHSGGLSVNVGDFLCIGSQEELDNTDPASKSTYYDEGKVNVRINKEKGLYNSGSNKLGINIAAGTTYPTSAEDVDTNWNEGGLKFVPPSYLYPGNSPLAVNTGMNASGLGVKNEFVANIKHDIDGEDEVTIVDNVLVIQPFTFINDNDGKNTSGLDIQIDVLEEDIVHKIPTHNLYTTKMWNTETEISDDMNNNPSNFSEDYVYCANGKRYIFDSSAEDKCVPYILYYSNEDSYNSMKDVMNDPGMDTSHLSRVMKRRCHVLIIPHSSPDKFIVKAMIYQTSVIGVDDLRVPDLDHNGVVDERESNFILNNLLITTPIHIYSNPSHNAYYSDAELTTPVTPAEGVIYVDENDYSEDADSNKYLRRLKGVKDPDTQIVSLQYYYCGDHIMSAEDWMNADVDRNGIVNQIDASRIISFYIISSMENYSSLTLNEKWRKYLREEMGINVESTSSSGSVVDILDYTFEKGVRIRYNSLKGITTTPEYVANDQDMDSENLESNDLKNMIGIKIADPTSGMMITDATKYGGLRFGTEGYLGVRVNNNNNFNPSIPTKNDKACIDDMSTGTKGLHIYGDNVLGVQLTKDGKSNNGELRIDEDGNLRLASSENMLRFTDGNTTIPYNGTEEVTITLGPGLCFGNS